MDSYLMMLYVTLEQESALKQFFLEHGWPYSKPDLSIITDKLGPAKCILVSSPVLLSKPISDEVELAKSSQVQSSAPDIQPTSKKPSKRKAKPPPRYAVKEKQAKVAPKQHSTRTSKQKDTITYIDIDTAGPSNVSADPSNISADPGNTSSGPSNSAAGPSNIVAGPSKTAAKTVKILSITGLDGEETRVKIEVPDAKYEKESVNHFKCLHCEKAFSSAWSKNNHEKGCMNPFEYTCKICFRGFKQRSGLHNHTQAEHVKLQEGYTCKVCLSVFKYSTGLSRHMKEKHQTLDVSQQTEVINDEMLQSTTKQCRWWNIGLQSWVNTGADGGILVYKVG